MSMVGMLRTGLQGELTSTTSILCFENAAEHFVTHR